MFESGFVFVQLQSMGSNVVRLPMIFSCVLLKKVILQGWNDMRVRKWWKNCLVLLLAVLHLDVWITVNLLRFYSHTHRWKKSKCFLVVGLWSDLLHISETQSQCELLTGSVVQASSHTALLSACPFLCPSLFPSILLYCISFSLPLKSVTACDTYSI